MGKLYIPTLATRDAAKFHGADGFTYWTCGYGPRFGDFTGQYVSLVPGKAEEAAEKAAEWETEELPGYCEEACGDCAFCCPDVVTGMETNLSARDLFSARELMRHRRDLLKGDVVFLDR
jgi:hypothetical protein